MHSVLEVLARLGRRAPRWAADPATAPFDDVLSAAQAGAGWAVTQLYRRFNPTLTRYLRSQATNEAEDLASDTWLAIAGGLPRFSGGERAFRGWVFAIAANQVRGHYRKAQRPRTTSWPPTNLQAGHPADVAAAAAAAAAGTLASDAAIAELTGSLPPDMAEVVRLRVIARLTAAETGKIMGRGEGAVRVLQRRALQRLAAIAPPQAD